MDYFNFVNENDKALLFATESKISYPGYRAIDVHMDITSLIGELPPFIEKAELLLEEGCDLCKDGRTLKKSSKERILYALETIHFHADKIADGNIDCDTKELTLTCSGGNTLTVWCSEWGGIRFAK